MKSISPARPIRDSADATWLPGRSTAPVGDRGSAYPAFHSAPARHGARGRSPGYDPDGGAPGIYSARYSGVDASDQQNLEKLLDALKDVPDDQRQAQFHCVLVYLRHAEDPTPLVCHGSWPGVITRQAAGHDGFGYDPIFFVPSEGKTAAELSREEKSAISHRGQALKLLLDALRNG